MPRKILLLYMFLIVSLLSTSFSRARKLPEDVSPGRRPPTFSDQSSYLTALPKEKVLKGHSFAIDEKLIIRHLRAIGRILRESAPNPGTGN
ncbi:Unknown protein [Striga hermonthica]|uniref:Uncharacterized protein n=1 Tax=Striga hermonthica TaxID=68872 RepID=A0A9N7RGY0_STRHE|nr:Unknown protein [Striga hermonthica]